VHATPEVPLFPYTTLFRSLHVARGVEASGGPRGEEPVGRALEREAAGEDLVHLGPALVDRELAAAEAADVAVLAVGAERRVDGRSEEHTSELQSQSNLVCR